MANYRFLNVFGVVYSYTDTDGNDQTEDWWRDHKWSTINRQEEYFYRARQAGEDISEDDRPEKYPFFIDQWKQSTDPTRMDVAWTNKSNGYIPQYTDLPRANNMFAADGMNCELLYPMIVTPPTTVGGLDGTIKVRASGSYFGNYTFRLTHSQGTITNSTGIFTTVPAGACTLIIEDTNINPEFPIAASSTYTDFVTMPDHPNYRPRYTGSFQNDMGRTVTIEILRKGYTGVAEEICFGGTPLILSTDVIGDDFIGGAIPTEMKLDLLQEYDGQYDDMFITDKEMWALRVVDTGFLDMTGLLMVSQAYISHQDNPIHIQMTAYAGITDLGDEDIEGWSGKITLIDAIAAFQELNILKYPIREFIGMRETRDPIAYTEDTLRRYSVNAGMFNGKTPKDALNGLLESFGATMTVVRDNHLYIKATVNNTLDVNVPYTGASYSSAGVYLDPLIVVQRVIDIKCDRTEDAFYIEGGQAYGYLSKVSKLSVVGAVEEIDGWEMPIDISKYNLMASTAGAVYFLNAHEDYMAIGGAREGSLYTQAERNKCSSGNFELYGHGVRLEASADLLLWNPNEKEQNLVRDYAGMSVLVGDNGSMSNEVNIDNGLGYFKEHSPSVSMQWNTVEMDCTTLGHNETGTGFQSVRMWMNCIWRESRHGEAEYIEYPEELHFKNAFIKALLPEDHEEIATPYVVDVGEDGEDLGEIELMVADAPTEDGYSMNFGGIMAREDLSNTLLWSSLISPISVDFIRQYADRLMALRSKDLKRLDGVLSTDYPNQDTLIYDRTIAGGFFIPQHFSYDVKFCKLEFSGLQMTSSSGRRLLEDDFFRLTEDGNKRDLE